MEYMEVPEVNPGSDGLCSDNDCPCGFPGAKIPRGSGYMYVSKEVVDFRRDALTVREAERKIANLKQRMGGDVVLFAPNSFAPILMCEQGAKKRGLDLKVAAADAAHWWKTGLVPLRATPLAGKAAAKPEKTTKAAPKPEKTPKAEKPTVVKTKTETKKPIPAAAPLPKKVEQKAVASDEKPVHEEVPVLKKEEKSEPVKQGSVQTITEKARSAVADFIPQKADLTQNIWLALANLNPFGAGFWLTKQFRYGALAVGGGVLLLLAGHFMNASKNPTLWGWLFLLYFLGLAVFTWVLLKKNKLEVTLPTWLPHSTVVLPVLAVLANVVFYGGFLAYRSAGNNLYQKGMEAYQKQEEVESAFGNLYAFNTYYRLSLNPLVLQVEKPLGEVALLIHAETQVEMGEYGSALDTLAKFKTLYPSSKRKAQMDTTGFDAYLGLARQQDEQNLFEDGQQSLRLAFIRFPAIAHGHEQKLMDAYSAHYLAWGNHLAVEKEYAIAIEKFEYLIANYPKSDEYKPAYDAAGQAYVDLAAQLSADKKDEEAALNLEKVLTDYDKSPALAKAKEALPAAYLNWSKVLESKKQYLIAMEKMKVVKEMTTSAQLISQADAEYAKLVGLLAKDTGTDGKAVLAEAKAQACKGQTPTSPAVGILAETSGKALFCSSSDANIYAPILAASPGELKYVINTDYGTRTVQICPYTNGRSLERYQSYKDIEVIEISSGESVSKTRIYGASPPSCPYFHYFTGMTDSMGGGIPDNQKILDWLLKVLK